MFILLAGLVLLALILGLLYLSVRSASFPSVENFTGGNKRKGTLICLGIYLALLIILFRFMNMVNAVIIFVHLIAFWLLFDLLFLIWGLVKGRRVKRFLAGFLALTVTVIYMSVAYYLCNNVWQTDYRVHTDKQVDALRIIQFADSHMGSTFHADTFRDYVKRMNETKPDLVLITGDFVDDDTGREDMIAACEALSLFESTYGVFFCYGNHDEGYFNDEYKNWRVQDLEENLEKNGVGVLKDESVLLGDSICLVGRKDRSEESRGRERMSPEELLKDLDRERYIIVMDHQPRDYDSLAKAGADLVLGGHTHGGQFFPFNQMGVITKEYEKSYGMEQRGNTSFIVTSGISDWALLFKTGCKSEYVFIEVVPDQG